MSTERYVIWIGRSGEDDWRLPPAVGSEWGFGGGPRTMHELAVAIAATGRSTEIRGDVDTEELHALSEAAGAMPAVPTEPRSPERGDVVLVGEGYADPFPYARISLSGARAILMLLAPPGLFGWPFVDGWSRPPPATVPLAALALPDHFRAMAAMGFELWTHMPRMAEQVEAAGVHCSFIGNGRPSPYPQPLQKRYDVVTLRQNRWAPRAREVVAQLADGVTYHEIASARNAQVLEQFGQARVLIHPMRIEGHSRVGCEARAMGAVPVVLDTNPYAVGMDEAGGAIAVASVEEMPTEVMALLRNGARLGELADRGMRTARAQVDWDAYVGRIDDALRVPAREDPSRAARAVIGQALVAREEAARAQYHVDRQAAIESSAAERNTIERERSAEVGELHAARASIESMAAERDTIERERSAAVDELDAARAEIHAMTGTRAWRLARQFWRVRAGAQRLALRQAGRERHRQVLQRAGSRPSTPEISRPGDSNPGPLHYE